jgi:PIN domain nuclease of toxin-antitoxin system
LTLTPWSGPSVRRDGYLPPHAPLSSRARPKSAWSRLWEVILKKRRVTAAIREPLPWWQQHVTRTETEVIPIRVPHLTALDRLPGIRGDPFDRRLVAQALAEDCTLVTADSTLTRYGVPVVWD